MMNATINYLNDPLFEYVRDDSDSLIELNGENDYIIITNSPAINTGNQAQRTVSLWFKANNINNSDQKQILYEEGGSIIGLNIYIDNGFLYVGGWNRKDSNWQRTFLSTDGISNDTWYNVAVVLDAETGLKKTTDEAFSAYLDGNLIGTGKGAELSKRNNNIGIGGISEGTRFHDSVSNNLANNYSFDGTIQEVQIYDQALNTTEIESLYQSFRPPEALAIGTNLSGIADWSTQLPFIDGFKSSRMWIPQTTGKWDTQEYHLLNLDQNNWVTSIPAPAESPKYDSVGTLLFREIDGNYAGGKYVVLYDGEGTIQYKFDAKKNFALSTKGRDVINVNPTDAGIYLKITATDPNKTGNYIRNIRVIPEAYESTYTTQIFNPDFIEKVDDFQAFRFMDWMETNNSNQAESGQRPTLDSSSFAINGVPVEIMVELANQTYTDPWFTMPHQATDEYVTEFATYVRDHLNPDLKVYVEYSNEVWNSQFQQGKWIETEARYEWANSSESNYNLRLDWYGKRTTEITQIWDQVFGDQKDQVIGVIGAQAANTYTGSRALDYAWTQNPLTNQEYGIDAIAIAPYFGGYLGSSSNQSQVQNWTIDNLFDELLYGGVLTNGPQGGALAEAYGWMDNYIQLANENNLELLAYEGGQHLVGVGGVENNQTITNLFIEANRDPRMGEIYEEYFTTWFNKGGGLFVNYTDITTPSKWGSWGLLESVNQDSSPKYDAVMGLLDGA